VSFSNRVLILVAVFILSILSSAQEHRARLSGVVQDSSGAIVPGASVLARETTTNSVSEARTNEAGTYAIPFLLPGTYTVEVEMRGFKKITQRSVELRVADRVQLDFRLETGDVQDTVTVSGEAPLLESATASRGTVIGRAQVQDLPLIGRNPFMLSLLAPGVTWSQSRPSQGSVPFANGAMDVIWINGARPLGTEFLLDGVPNSNTEVTGPNNLSFVPSPDSTAEFRVQTNNYDAQYGRTSGGVINVSTRSGTNQLHGSLYHYLRNAAFNANLSESNRIGVPRTAYRWNQPGLAITGPVYIPKLYNGKDRTFFTFTWEKILENAPSPATQTVPTALQRNGDFSQTVAGNLQPITLFDPASVSTANGASVRNVFPGSIIPANRMNPISRRLVQYYPLPNNPGNSRGFNNSIIAPNDRQEEYDQFIARIDHSIGSKHRMFGRYTGNKRNQSINQNGFVLEASPNFRHYRVNQGGAFDVTSAINPTTVLSTRIGFIRHEFAIRMHGDGFDPTALGFPSSLVSQLPNKFFPRLTFEDYAAFGPQRVTGSQYTHSETRSISHTVSKIVSAHQLKFGGEYRAMMNNQQNPTSYFAQFNFSRAFTRRDPLLADAQSGNAVASLLLGLPDSGLNAFNVAPAYNNRYYVGFLQDDWRVNTRLTLNLGIRWDYESPISERFNRMNAGFDTTSRNPLQVPGLDLRGGLLFTSDANRLPMRRDLNNWQPRLGAAYLLSKNMVLRGGYGLMYMPTFDVGQTNGFSTTTPYVASLNGGITPLNNLSNPFPDGLLQPVGSTRGLATLMGTNFNYSNTERVIPMVQQFSLGIQRQLPWRMVADVSYVGNRTRNLQVAKGINEVSAENLSLGNALVAQVANPFRGLIPGTGLNNATVARQQLLRPFPQFGSINELNRSLGRSNYNALQIHLEKRMSNGVHFSVAYTYSNIIEAISYLNPQDDWGNLAQVVAGINQKQRTVVNGGWDIGLFKNSSNGFVKTLLGGWQVNGMITFQPGFPITAPSGFYSSGIDPSLPDGVRTRERWFNTCYLDTVGVRRGCSSPSEAVAWIQQPNFTLRTLSPRLRSLQTRRTPLADVSVFKSFAIKEGINLQFRGEAFNVSNTPWFGEPNVSLTSAQAGLVSPTQFNDPRFIQLALRLSF
jgi:hypothetical protein